MQSTVLNESAGIAGASPSLLTSTPQVPYWDRENDQDLVCTEVRQETHDVKTFTFRAQDARYFGFAAGEYFSFDFDINGERVSRCYSVSTSALKPHTFSVTVKRVAGGTVSNWLHDHLQPGSTVRAMGPLGHFKLDTAADDKYLFISGGAGITPVMSMLRTLGDAHHYPDIVFFHAGRSPQDLVFEDELRQRARSTPNLRVFFLPERADARDGYTGLTGRISQALLALAVPDLAERMVLCCGPAPFMQATRTLSAQMGVPAARYLEENFGAADAAAQATAAIAHAASPATSAPALRATADTAGPACRTEASPNTAPNTPPVAPLDAPQAAEAVFSLNLLQQQKTVAIASNTHLLGAMRQAGLHIPSSCGEGLCGTCKTKLVSGQVDMQHSGGIRQREIDAGFFLPCCSTPRSDLVIDR